MEISQWVAGHLTGGLGNRLFQHAAAAGLAEKWNYSLVFCLPECEPTNHGPFESIFELMPWIPKVTQCDSVQRLREPHGGVFTYTPFPSEPTAQFVSVDGWRQSEKYFPTKGIEVDFANALSLQRQSALLTRLDLNEEERFTTWFLHVRLGDYKILPHHQIDMNKYYSKAIQHIPEGARVLLFCDELKEYGATLLEYFRKLGLRIEPADVEDEVEALLAMSCCLGGAIVANSTFSWWGAYFAHKAAEQHSFPRPSGFKAIYPAIWGQGLPTANDVVPSWGIKIPNGEN